MGKLNLIYIFLFLYYFTDAFQSVNHIPIPRLKIGVIKTGHFWPLIWSIAQTPIFR